METPKRRLKEAQRWVLREVLNAVPPHPDVHGFRRGRSARTAAEPHVGHAVLLRLDLEDFFASVGFPSVYGVFRGMGYNRAVALAMARLCTVEAPRAVLQELPPSLENRMARGRQAMRLRARHLPTGAPTSPALANLAALRLDIRLKAAAAKAGATYTRYADDLAFSGGPEFDATAFAGLVRQIAADAGFRVNDRKTRVARKGARQMVAGVVVNERTSMPRGRYDNLKAALHNCQKHGPLAQANGDLPAFRAWLVGSVAAAQAIDPVRGGKLAARLALVDWSR